MLREGGRVAIKSAGVIAVLEALLVFAGVFAAKGPLQASAALYKTAAGDWYEAAMPAVLFALAGGALASLLGWRLTASSGLTGPAALRIGLIAWALVEGAAILAAILAFGGAVPITFWIAWAALSLVGSVGIMVFTVWMA